MRVRPVTTWWRGIALATLAATSVACSLITSLDGLASGPADGAAGGFDAGGLPIADAAGGHDATGSAADATPVEGDDAGDTAPFDAGVEAASGDAGYCGSLSPAPLFCDDFDEAPLKTGWDRISSTNGTASLNTTHIVSPPFSMQVLTNGGSSMVDCAGYKTFSKLTAGPKVLTLSFDLRIPQADTSSSSDAIVGAIQLFDGAGNTWDLQLELAYDGSSGKLAANLSEHRSPAPDGGTTYTGHATSGQIPSSTWIHVAMELTLSAPLVPFGPASARLLFDGSVVGAPTGLQVNTTNPTPEILVGATFVNAGNGGWTLRYDNVTFDIR